MFLHFIKEFGIFFFFLILERHSGPGNFAMKRIEIQKF